MASAGRWRDLRGAVAQRGEAARSRVQNFPTTMTFNDLGRTHLVHGAGAALLLVCSLPRPHFVGQVTHVIATTTVVLLSVAVLEWKLRDGFALALRWSAFAVPLGILVAQFFDAESLILPSVIGTLVAVVCSSGRAISTIPKEDERLRSWCLAGWEATIALVLAALHHYHAVPIWAPVVAACSCIFMSLRGGRPSGRAIVPVFRRGAAWACLAVAMGLLFMSPFIILALAGKHDGPRLSQRSCAGHVGGVGCGARAPTSDGSS